MALETNVDRELCVQAADRALAYLRERVLDNTYGHGRPDGRARVLAPHAARARRRDGAPGGARLVDGGRLLDE